MKIIDTHVHFWDPARLDYDWLMPLEAISRPHLPADYYAETEGIEVAGVVMVEAGARASQYLDEARWVEGLGAPVLGIVANAPLDLGARARPALEQLAAMPKIKGIRRITQDEPLGFAAQASYIDGVRLLPEYGFSCDLCAYHPQLPDLIRLIDACPDVSFVLDHVGKPGIRAGEIDAWRRDIETLAGFPNLACKLSGMVTEADHNVWTIDQLRPYVDIVVGAFGYERLMYGSDWPVVKLASPYKRWWQTVDALISPDPADRQRLFHDNAKAFYRL